MVPALATPQQLADFLQRYDIPPATATLALDAASGTVRRYLRGQIISAVAGDQVTLRGSSSRELVLPQRPVTAVTAVVLNGVAVTDYTPLDDTLHRAVGWATRVDTNGISKVLVTYNHGFPLAQMPFEITAAVLDLAARCVSNPENLHIEQIGGTTYTYAIETLAGKTLSQAHGETLKPYRRRAGSTVTSL